ncbi:hypothetical protein [Gorillibacterium massiliense]|uniref:hypothetical protein n=1 Tax=Gorillibacterium massiliense TaxID=1280390 RepID=UPI000592A2C4|nr:hypothetical protein [Gorillibacterium massiliense]
MNNQKNEVAFQKIKNKYVIIGITILDHEDNLLERHQLHGRINRIDDRGVYIHLNDDPNNEYTLPPDLNAFQEAPSGEYRLKKTGEVVVDPDFMTTWTIRKPKKD